MGKHDLQYLYLWQARSRTSAMSYATFSLNAISLTVVVIQVVRIVVRITLCESSIDRRLCVGVRNNIATTIIV